MNDDLETADISTRVHNTRPHQEKVYSPIGRGNSNGNKLPAGGNDEYYDGYEGQGGQEGGGGEDIKFFDSGRDVSPSKKHKKTPSKHQQHQQHREHEDRDRVQQEQQQQQMEALNYSPVEKAEKLFNKITKKISMVFERDDQAKLIVHLLIKLRQQYVVDDEVLSEAFRWGLVQVLLSNSEKLYKFSSLVEETLNCVLPIVRTPALTDKAMHVLMKSGALIFCMTAIRMFHTSNGNIRVLAVELLSYLLDFVDHCTTNPNTVSNKIKKFMSKNYVIHHLLLHGAASSFPSLLNIFIQSSSEISTNRVLKCLTFVLTETPPDMSVTVAMNNRWGMLRDLLNCVRTLGPTVKVQAAVLLTGLIASSAVVAEKLIDMQAWDDLSTALVSPDLDFSCMPEAWLERSMETMKLLQARNISSKKVKIPQQSICEKFTFISFEQDSQNTSTFDHITRPRDYDLHASTLHEESGETGGGESESVSDSRRLAELPSAFWPQTSPHVMRDEVNESKAPNMKTRLKSSPFGDPSSILERNKQQRQTSKLCQQKITEGTSRLLRNPHPNKVLRTSQRKKLYPSQPQYHQQLQQQHQNQNQTSRNSSSSRGRGGRSKHDYSGPVEVPADTVQQKVVAEKLFATTTTSSSSPSSRPSSGARSNAAGAGAGAGVGTYGGGEDTTSANADDNKTQTQTPPPSSMDHLSYAERLQVMILHCQDSFNYNDDDEV